MLEGARKLVAPGTILVVKADGGAVPILLIQ